MTKGNIDVSYGLIVSKMTVGDFPADTVSVIYTCNKARCNSRNSTKQVHQMLIDAKLLPTPSPISTSTKTNNGQKSIPSIVFISLISYFLF